MEYSVEVALVETEGTGDRDEPWIVGNPRRYASRAQKYRISLYDRSYRNLEQRSIDSLEPLGSTGLALVRADCKTFLPCEVPAKSGGCNPWPNPGNFTIVTRSNERSTSACKQTTACTQHRNYERRVEPWKQKKGGWNKTIPATSEMKLKYLLALCTLHPWDRGISPCESRALARGFSKYRTLFFLRSLYAALSAARGACFH